jgi:alpha-tubulin suppressor-like RCC1 family protein
VLSRHRTGELKKPLNHRRPIRRHVSEVPMRRVSGFLHQVLALLFLASCDGEELSGPSSIVETVAVIPGVFSMVVDDTIRLTIIARGDIGNPLVGRPVVWETSSASVATVSASGLVTAVGTGAVNINATVEGKVGTATITVSPHFATEAFASVTAGGAHSCALTTNGVAYCWGRGESGQLGVPPPVTTCLSPPLACALVPFPVAGGLKFERLSAGGAYTCGLTSDGTAWCWGSNSFGQLGDGTQTTRNAPVAVATTERFTRIAAGQAHTCALTVSGAAWCWGANTRGELGDGTTQRRTSPVQVVAPDGVAFQQIASGADDFRGFTCGLASTGTAWCWGANDRGQLGRGNRDLSLSAHPQPAPVSGSLVFATLVAGFADHVCGLTAAGAAYCWGAGSYGQLGDGLTVDSWLPLALPGGMSFVQVLPAGPSGDGGFTCGLTSSGAAYCWGSNTNATVGDGTTGGQRTRPVAVTGSHQFASLSAGMGHVCGRTVGGVVYCWGSGRAGQLGTNYTSVSAQPVKVIGQP